MNQTATPSCGQRLRCLSFRTLACIALLMAVWNIILSRGIINRASEGNVKIIDGQRKRKEPSPRDAHPHSLVAAKNASGFVHDSSSSLSSEQTRVKMGQGNDPRKDGTTPTTIAELYHEMKSLSNEDLVDRLRQLSQEIIDEVTEYAASLNSAAETTTSAKPASTTAPQENDHKNTADPGDKENDNHQNHDSHEPLPSCEDLMRRPHSSFADGAFLTRKTTPVVWKMRHDGSRELTLPFTCRLKRYTAQQAGTCLRNKNLLFIGDSLTRYQFLSLAYFLEHQKWPQRFLSGTGNGGDGSQCQHVDENGNEACSKWHEPNVCAEGEWMKFGGWPGYFQNLGGGTDGGLYRGRMESQSVRTDPAVENMRYISKSSISSEGREGGYPDGDSGNGRTKLTYVLEAGWLGTEPFFGWKFTGCAYNATCRYTPEQYEHKLKRFENEDFDWNYPNITTAFGRSNGTVFRDQHFDINYVFYNRGLWGSIQYQKAQEMLASIYEMTEEGRTYEQSKSNRCFYRSTTGCQRSRDENEIEMMEYGPVRLAAYEAGCEYFDIAHITDEFSRLLFTHPAPPRNVQFEFSTIFWDAVHYLPWVYEELNNLLLNVLCNTHT